MPELEERTDRELLKAFADARDEAAFAELVRRHGPLVWSVCRRVLGRSADVEDAAQAAFLALAQHASRFEAFRSVAPWLHRVGHDIAVNHLKSRKVRERREKEAAMMNLRADDPAGLSDEQGAVLHEEIDALPEKHRQAVILFHLEGKSLAQAATAMAYPESTVGTWLARGRERLRSRLTRRGLVLSLAALTSLLSTEAGAAELPVTFVSSTSKAAALLAGGGTGSAVTGATALSSRALSMAEGVVAKMYYAKMRMAVVVVALVCCICGGGGWAIFHSVAAEEPAKVTPPVPAVRPVSPAVSLRPVMPEVVGDKAAAPLKDADRKALVEGNTAFTFDLYRQLAKENEGKDLFFSSYSVSSALAMTAEGARGETALQMGKVLYFPKAARRDGADAQHIPYDTSLIHAGMAELSRKLKADPAKTAALRAEIAKTRAQLDATQKRMTQLQTDRKWAEVRAARPEERKLVAQLNKLYAQVDPYEIRVANALWGEKTYPFNPAYVKTIDRYYDSGGLFPVDFKNAFEPARLEINKWVEEQTNNRIKELLPFGILTADTRLVLTNAIYFKGEWAKPFNGNQTRDRDFTLADGTKKKTATMCARGLAGARYAAFNGDGSFFKTPDRMLPGQDTTAFYPKADGFAMVELPYKGDALSMVVIAPNDPKGLSALERKLTSTNLLAWIGQFKKRATHVYLPRFKLETDYTLGDADKPATLQKMGMVRAFDRDLTNGAQFYGMTTSTDPRKQLFISKVLHKAFVEVNEKGTEAAAATAVIMGVKTCEPKPITDIPFIPEFKADRPFLFLIRDVRNGSVLFMGRMMNPKA